MESHRKACSVAGSSEEIAVETACVKRLLTDERGTEVVEWSIILGTIAVAVLILLVALGGWVFGVFSALNNHFAG